MRVAEGRLNCQTALDDYECNLVVDVISADAVGVHEVGAALAGGGRALRHVGVVLRAPVVPKLVRRHQVRLTGDHSLKYTKYLDNL